MAVILVFTNGRITKVVTHAYTSPKQPHVSRMNHPTPQMTEDALTEKDSATAATTGAQPLPPWLSRHAIHTKESVERQVEGLEFALLDHGMSPMDVRDVALTMESASKGDQAKLAGMVDFLKLILDLEWGEHIFVTRQLLLASVLHYGDCVTARETGVYEMVRDAIFRDVSVATAPRLLPPAVQVKPPTTSRGQTAAIAVYVPTTAMVLPRNDDGVGEYDEDVMVIARGAARVKRAEIMVQTVLGPGRIPSKEEAIRIRGLLLSVMDDWRAMGIRTAACLFRLNGLIHDFNNGGSQYTERAPEVVHAAREALCVYAPLAQRLGMQRLKNKIEDSAFQLLYKRQYNAVSGLYQHSGPAIKAISRHLEDQISEVLLRNQALMEQLEDIQITSRVKEPYSSWKKLLKVRKLDRALPSATSALALVDLKDMVALRIVLRAKKWSEDESVETTRGREKLLCYFVQHLLRSEWPELDESRLKDYIQHPKANGYQSLHYTSSIASQSVRWPFEVQVRSDEMHKNAEYGFAAHWDYKDDQTAEALAPAPLQALPEGEESDMKQISTSGEGIRPLEVISVAEQSYIDALVNAKQSLVQQKIFCFFAGAIDNKGQLLSLPIGSTVADAMEQLQDMTGTVVLGAKILINGRKAELHDLVVNGDVLLVSL